MKKYLTTSQAAKLCNVHRNTILYAIKISSLKAHKTPGGHSRISIENLTNFCVAKDIIIEEDIRTKTRVLIVDDDINLTKILTSGLELENYEVAFANNGYDAGFLTSDFKPNIILLNVLLTDINFDVICKTLRKHKEAKSIIIIAISTLSNSITKNQMLKAGANIFIAKPFDLKILLAEIKKFRWLSD